MQDNELRCLPSGCVPPYRVTRLFQFDIGQFDVTLRVGALGTAVDKPVNEWGSEAA